MRRDYRLRRHSEVRAVLSRGRRLLTPLFQVMTRPNQSGHIRVVCIASRKVDKRAVVRNRLRRRVRERIRKDPALISLPLDLALIFHKAAAEAPRAHFYEVLNETIRSILSAYSNTFRH